MVGLCLRVRALCGGGEFLERSQGFFHRRTFQNARAANQHGPLIWNHLPIVVRLRTYGDLSTENTSNTRHKRGGHEVWWALHSLRSITDPRSQLIWHQIQIERFDWQQCFWKRMRIGPFGIDALVLGLTCLSLLVLLLICRLTLPRLVSLRMLRFVRR